MKNLLSFLCVISIGVSPLTANEVIKTIGEENADFINHFKKDFGVSDREVMKTLVHEHEATMAMYDSFVEILRKADPSELSEQDIQQILDAMTYGAACHSTQTRKNDETTPYIIHPMGVAKSLWELGGVHDKTVLIAAILHDVVEDTEGTLEQIEKLFGPEVAGIVNEVTDDKSLPKAKRKELQIQNAPKKSHGAKLVKLADKLNNLQDMLKAPPKGWSAESVTEYAIWAQKVIKGLKGTNPALEKALDGVLKEFLANKAVSTAKSIYDKFK